MFQSPPSTFSIYAKSQDRSMSIKASSETVRKLAIGSLEKTPAAGDENFIYLFQHKKHIKTYKNL